MIRIHNIYVSHAWSQADTYDKLVRVLQSDPQFPYRLFGLPKDDPVHTSAVAYELRAAMRHPMTQCHVLVVPTGVFARYGKWIIEELELATAGLETRRRVLAIDVFAPESKPTPVQTRADRVIGWSKTGIVEALRELAAMPTQQNASYAAKKASEQSIARPGVAAIVARPRFALPAGTPSMPAGARPAFGRAASSSNSRD